MQHRLLQVLLFPGNFVTSAAHLDSADNERMVRLLVNMLFWNTVILMMAVAVM